MSWVTIRRFDIFNWCNRVRSGVEGVMPISLTCPSCGDAYHLAEAQAGKVVRCRKCGSAIHVPVGAGDTVAVGEQSGVRGGIIPDYPSLPVKNAAAPAAFWCSLSAALWI